jgi:catechol 2,3-dioxygenase-like lactoylglutathione lyase family enzyme
MRSPSPSRSLAIVALVVRDYDEAIDYYTRVLGFTLVEDRDMPAENKRWVVVSPGAGGARLLLARASNEAQHARIGDQAGGRVFLFLHTDDIARDVARYREHGVRFHGAPREEPYGKVVVFDDLYGNRWDLIEPAGESA